MELGGFVPVGGLEVDPLGTVGGVEPAGGFVVLEPVLDPEPISELDPVVPEVEPLVPVLDPLLVPLALPPDPLLIPLELMFFWMLAGQVSEIMSTRSTTNSLFDALDPAPMLEVVEEFAVPLVFPATPVLDEPLADELGSLPLAMAPLVPPLPDAEPLAFCSVPCSFTWCPTCALRSEPLARIGWPFLGNMK